MAEIYLGEDILKDFSVDCTPHIERRLVVRAISKTPYTVEIAARWITNIYVRHLKNFTLKKDNYCLEEISTYYKKNGETYSSFSQREHEYETILENGLKKCIKDGMVPDIMAKNYNLHLHGCEHAMYVSATPLKKSNTIYTQFKKLIFSWF